MKNQELARLFHTIADLLEIQGAEGYRVAAYRRAAGQLADLEEAVETLWQQGKLTQIPGIGKALAAKIDEYLRTGRLDFLERLQREVPSSLLEWLQIPGLGPRKTGAIWRALGISTLEELEAAAQAGRLRQLKGMGARSETNILAGIREIQQRTDRLSLDRVWPHAETLCAHLRQVPGVERVEVAGSLRRGLDTAGNLDLVIATEALEAVPAALSALPDVSLEGEHLTLPLCGSLAGQIPLHLWPCRPAQFGAVWVFATGSREHIRRLNERAQQRGLRLSASGLARTADGQLLATAGEHEVYSALGLPWIPPELREDRGEIEAAVAGTLPSLLQEADLVAELHTHSTWSDGRAAIREMAETAIAYGLRLLVITDHSRGLGVAGGLDAEALRRQRLEIRAVQQALGDQIILLQGVEVEIRADGTLDLPDSALAELDLVIASLHSGLRQPRERITARLIRAIQHPLVDLIGHPTGRLIPRRAGADLDMEAVLQAAAEHRVALEINANPRRLDLPATWIPPALQRGVLLAINTDAHAPQDFGLRHFGVRTARRGGATANHILNAWPPERLLTWLRDRKRLS